MGEQPSPFRPLVIVGPTASGKSGLALDLARARRSTGHPVEIVSADSMAVYRGMDIGTTTPARAERDEFPHHLIDVVEVDQDYSVARFAGDVRAALAGIESRGASAIMVGGTGLYVRTVVDSLEIPGQFPDARAEQEQVEDTGELYRRLVAADPDAAQRIEAGNRRRILRALEVCVGSGRPFSSFGPGLESYPPTQFVMVGLRVPRADLDRLIRARLQTQMAAGFLDEVAALQGRARSRTAAQALGYGELTEHLEGRSSLEEALERIVQRSRRFAVRQDRWFRRDPRIHWIDTADPAERLTEALGHWSS